MFKNIIKANENIKKYILRTPTKYSNTLSELVNKNVYVKYENTYRETYIHTYLLLVDINIKL